MMNKQLIRLAVCAVVISFVGGCADKEKSLVEQTEVLTKAICACTTVACAEPHIAALKQLTAKKGSQIGTLSDKGQALLMRVQLMGAQCEDRLRAAAKARGSAPAAGSPQ